MYKVCVVGIEEVLLNSEIEKLNYPELGQCEFVFIALDSSMEHLVSRIIEHKPDALISEFMLPSVKYNGNDIVLSIAELRPFTSCFIVTREVLESERDWRMNVNIIYDYKEMALVLKSKLLQSIYYQKGRISTFFSKMNSLIQKGDLTLREEDDLKNAYSLLIKQFPDNTVLRKVDIENYSTFKKRTQSLIDQAEGLLKELKG